MNVRRIERWDENCRLLTIYRRVVDVLEECEFFMVSALITWRLQGEGIGDVIDNEYEEF